MTSSARTIRMDTTLQDKNIEDRHKTMELKQWAR